MKHILALALLLMSLTACAVGVEQPVPLPAVNVPPTEAGSLPSNTPEVKVVEMATQTPVAATFTPIAKTATADPNRPTPTYTPVAQFQTLESLGVQTTTYQDRVAGLAFDYPAAWLINQLPEADRKSSYLYTTSLRSYDAARGPKQQEGIPPDMAAMDVTVENQGPKTLEQVVAERRAAAAQAEMGPVQVAVEQDWILSGGLKAHYFLINTGKDATTGSDRLVSELVTVINGKMVLVSGMGDQSLFSAIASTLREETPAP